MRSVQRSGGNLKRLVCPDSSQCPCLKDENISLLWVWGGHFSHESLKTCFKIEGWAKILEYNSVFYHGDLPASAFSSNFFSLKYSLCQGAVFWGSMFWTPSTPLLDQMIKRPKNSTSPGQTLLNYQAKNHHGDKLYIYKYCFSTRSRPMLLSNSCQAHS